MFRMGWETASGFYFPIPAHKKEGREEVSPVLLWGEEKRKKNLKMRER